MRIEMPEKRRKYDRDIKTHAIGRDQLLFATAKVTLLSRNTFRTRGWLPARPGPAVARDRQGVSLSRNVRRALPDAILPRCRPRTAVKRCERCPNPAGLRRDPRDSEPSRPTEAKGEIGEVESGLDSGGPTADHRLDASCAAT